MPNAIWKGAIAFGLVHIPVALYPGSSEVNIDFDWLDKRSMDPVGYKRVNKKTGKEIDKRNIVKGAKVEGGDYVVLSDDEIKAAYPKTTQTIEIESFVQAADIPFTQLAKPYYLEPISKGEKVYTLLREAMLEAGVIGIARVVMHTKEYLEALVPSGPGLVLNTLRWDEEIRPWTDLKLPDAGKGSLKAAELSMAKQLIGDMTQRWKAGTYADKFSGAIHALVAKRVEAGATEKVQPLEESGSSKPSNVLDLTALLKQSLEKKLPTRPTMQRLAKGRRRKSQQRSGQRASARSIHCGSTQTCIAAMDRNAAGAMVAAPSTLSGPIWGSGRSSSATYSAYLQGASLSSYESRCEAGLQCRIVIASRRLEVERSNLAATRPSLWVRGNQCNTNSGDDHDRAAPGTETTTTVG